VPGHDQVGLEGGHFVQQGDPGGALAGLGGVGGPDVLAGEQQHAAEDRAVLGLPQVVAAGQCVRAALQLEPLAFQVQVAVLQRQVKHQGPGEAPAPGRLGRCVWRRKGSGIPSAGADRRGRTGMPMTLPMPARIFTILRERAKFRG
jgi:hypothetical protein